MSDEPSVVFPTLWNIAEAHPAAEELAAALPLHPIVAQCLAARGIVTPEAAAQFLAPTLADLPDPFALPDMRAAVDRIVQALEQREPIGIFGDYDADGTTATALLVRFFRALGHDVPYYIPHRVTEGYGLSLAGYRALAERGVRVVITVDTGSSGQTVIAQARDELGIVTIITDHHAIPEVPTAAAAVVNPQRLPAGDPLRVLCGVGMALMFAMALRARLRELPQLAPRGVPNLKQWLDLVAVGTIADLVPLIGPNRILASIGLQQLRAATNPGLRALLDAAGTAPGELTAHHVAFRVAPRLNAAGRMAHAVRAVELLTTDDAATARTLAEELTALNHARQSAEGAIFAAADAQLRVDPLWATRAGIVVADADWSPGVVGIVAGRLAEHYRLPTIVCGVHDTVARGSGRTVGAFPLLQAIGAASAALDHWGGHDAAAGITLAAADVPRFRDDFDRACRELLTPAHRQPTLALDALVQPADITDALRIALQQLAPFGHSNPEPLFGLRNIVLEQPRLAGTTHLRGHVRTGAGRIGWIGFSLASRLPLARQNVDLAFTISPNEWNGAVSTQLVLRDLCAP